MKAKICIITTVDITLSQFVIPSARGLKDIGFDVTLVSSMSNEFFDEYKHEFNLINIPMERGVKLLGIIKGIISFIQIFNQNKYDVIQYSTPNASFYASIAGRLTKIPARLYCQWGIRYVGLTGIKREVFKYIEKITCNCSTDIRPASPKNMEFGIVEGLYKRDKAKVVGDGGAVGINLKQFDVKEKSGYREQILTQYPNLRDKIVFGFIGRLDKDKGIVELIEAFNNINDDSYLLIIGPEENKNQLSDSFFSQIKENERIICSGFVSNVAKYLSVFTILVHPSHREGFSAVIQQAMAMEVPIITTDIPGPSEVIEDNISGILVPPKSSAELCLAMQTLAKDSRMQKTFADNGLIRVKKLFTQERMTSLIINDRINIVQKHKI